MMLISRLWTKAAGLLLDLNGFSGLTSVGGSFIVVDEQKLTNIEGLSDLISVGGDFRMEYNPLLVNCKSLSPLLDNPVNNVGAFTAIAIGSDGLPVVNYRDHQKQTLKVLKCGTATCSRQ